MTQAPAQAAPPARETGSFVLPPEAVAAAISSDLEELRPQRALRNLGLKAAGAEALIAQLADAAIESMLAGESPAPVARPPEPTTRHAAQLPPARFSAPLERRSGERARDDFGAELSAREAAALQEEALDIAAAQIEVDSPAAIGMEMPTDEELAMLLRGMEEDDPSGAGGPHDANLDGSDFSVASAVARELEEAPLAALEEDADAIQAEGAIESRGTVNHVEPHAEHEPLSLAPAMRPVEPPGTFPPKAPWWIAPLVWLNAPLATARQSTRETLAKAAVLALLNATAILVYVLVIRR